MSFKEHFKGTKAENWTVTGKTLNSGLSVQSEDKEAICTIYGSGEKSRANAQLIAQSKEMAEFISSLYMERKNRNGLNIQEEYERNEAERILKLILK